MKSARRILTFVAIAYAFAFAWVWIIAWSKLEPDAVKIAFRDTARGSFLIWIAAAIPALLGLGHFLERRGRTGFWYDVLICVVAAVVAFGVYFAIEVIQHGFGDDDDLSLIQKVTMFVMSSTGPGIVSGFFIGLLFAALNRHR